MTEDNKQSKKIVLFSDGTGNSSSNPQKTHVWRVYQALDRSPGSNQIAYYDNGVGTSRFTPFAMLGLAFGWGLARNVRQIYRFLCRTYKPGDEIYGFGFSRGAFTMRVVMALIADQGIISPERFKHDERELNRLIVLAYRRYRQNNFTPSALSFFFRPLRDVIAQGAGKLRGRKPYDPKKNFHEHDLKDDQPLIKFVGVWDTVDAYGLPIDELTRAWDKVVWPLTAKDRDLSKHVGTACHALALDEQRESFEPMLWNEEGVSNLNQVWFAGVHADVGGGYPDDSLAYVPLNWMLKQSESAGLTYIKNLREHYKTQADMKGPMHNSRSGVGNLYRYAPRNLERLCKEQKPGLWNSLRRLRGDQDAETNDVFIKKPKLHHSIFYRMQNSGDNYAPINIPMEYAIVDDKDNVLDIVTENPPEVLPETKQQAQDRKERQAYAWNKVWGLKILYFITLTLVLFFALYPYFAKQDKETYKITSFFEQLLGTFSFVIHSIPQLIGKIPELGFIGDWASGYTNQPFLFLIMLIVIGILFAGSQVLRVALNNEMRHNWQHAVDTANENTLAHKDYKTWRTRLKNFFSDSQNTKGETTLSKASKISRILRIILEALAVIILLLFLLLAILGRITFIIADGFGKICSETNGAHQLGDSIPFNPKSTCMAAGLELTAGNHYAVEFTVSNDWQDYTLPADVNGLRSTSPYMYLFLPWRRHLFVDWYKPIARIDNKLFDRYPLRQSKQSDIENNVRQNYLQMEFTARRSGDLYLYLNDVLPLPLLKQFYENNEGKACFRVREIYDESNLHSKTQDQGENQLMCNTDN